MPDKLLDQLNALRDKDEFDTVFECICAIDEKTCNYALSILPGTDDYAPDFVKN